MKQFVPFIFVVLLILSGCSAKKYMHKGQYDRAIQKAVKKLKKKPNNIKHTDILVTSFNKANQRDRDRIKFLKLDGSPDIWNEVFNLYNKMKRRQNVVKSLPNIPTQITFTDYDEEIIQAKKKAAEYYYEHGVALLERNDRQSARQAYSDFSKVQDFYADYKDVHKKMQEALVKGKSYVILKMKNQTDVIMPKRFEQELEKITVADLNQQWVSYYTIEKEDMFYDYTILVNLKVIDVSPENVKEKAYTEKKEIQDGFQYVLDENGNVKKDTAGNDIKVPKYETITCTVTETIQKKAARVSGSLDYVNNVTGEVIKSEKITADAIFEHLSANATGNLKALKAETREKIKRKPVAFPTDEQLLLQASDQLKGMVKDIIFNNKSLLN